MVPSLEDPATPEHLSYHISSWHPEGHLQITVTPDNFAWWQDFHDRLPHPAGGNFHNEHTHTGWHR